MNKSKDRKRNIVSGVEKSLRKDVNIFNKEVAGYKNEILDDTTIDKVKYPEKFLKRPLKYYWDKTAFIVACSIAIFIVILIFLMIKYPLYVTVPILRFFLYSNTMMLPTILVSLVSFPLKLAISSVSYMVVAFLAYFILIYLLIFYYHLLNNPQSKKRYILGVIILYALLLALSMGFLIKGFYG